MEEAVSEVCPSLSLSHKTVLVGAAALPLLSPWVEQDFAPCLVLTSQLPGASCLLPSLPSVPAHPSSPSALPWLLFISALLGANKKKAARKSSPLPVPLYSQSSSGSRRIAILAKATEGAAAGGWAPAKHYQAGLA